MGAEEEDGKLDIRWFHSTVWDFIDLVGKKNKTDTAKQQKTRQVFTHSHRQPVVFASLTGRVLQCILM